MNDDRRVADKRSFQPPGPAAADPVNGGTPAAGDLTAAERSRRRRWLCRRGMKELDLALFAYLDDFHEGADQAERRAFDELLEWRDPDLFSFLLGSSEVPPGPEWRQLRKRLNRGQNRPADKVVE